MIKCLLGLHNTAYRDDEIFYYMLSLCKNPRLEYDHSKLILFLENCKSKDKTVINSLLSSLKSLHLDSQLENKVKALTTSFTDVPPHEEIMNPITSLLKNPEPKNKKIITLMVSFSLNFKSEERIMESMISLLNDTESKSVLQDKEMMYLMLSISASVKFQNQGIRLSLIDGI